MHLMNTSPTIKSVFCLFICLFLCLYFHLPIFPANSPNFHLLAYIFSFLATCLNCSNFGAHFLIQDNWWPVVMLCAYTQFVFESFSKRQITIFFFHVVWVAATVDFLFCLWFDCFCVLFVFLSIFVNWTVEISVVMMWKRRMQWSSTSMHWTNLIMHLTTKSIPWNQHEHRLASGLCARCRRRRCARACKHFTVVAHGWLRLISELLMCISK